MGLNIQRFATCKFATEVCCLLTAVGRLSRRVCAIASIYITIIHTYTGDLVIGMGGAMKMIKVPSLRLGILVTAVMVVFISGIHFAGSFRLAPSNHWTTSFTEVGPIHRVTSRYGFEISASSINTDGMTESTSNSRPWKVNRKMLLESSDTTSIRHSNESSNLSNKNIHKSSKEEILDSLFAQDTTMDAQSMATILEDETIVSRKEFACILKRLATCDPRYVSRVWGRAPVKWAYTRRLGNFLNQAELALEHQLHGDSAESMRKLNLVDSEEQRDFVISSLQNVLRSSSGMTVKALRGITVVCQIAGITKVNSSVTERILSLLDASISSLDMRALGKSMRIFIVDIWNWLSFNDTPWSNFPPSLQDKLLQLGDACAQDSKKVIITKHFASFRQYYKPTDTEKNHFKHWMEQYFDFNRLPTANTYPRMDRILLAIFETDALLTVQMYHTILNRYLGDLVGDHNLSAVVRDKDRYCNRLQAHFSNAASYKLLDQVTSLYRKCDNLTFVATSPFQVVDIYPRLDLLSYVTAVALSSPGFSSCNLKE